MSLNKSNIDWCTHTWNPATGCSKVSAGCKNCYAEAFHTKQFNIGQRGGNVPECYRTPFNEIKCWPDRLKLPGGQRKVIFVNSMGDLFHPDVPDEFIYDVFIAMSLRPEHTYIILTKRAQRMKSFMPIVQCEIPNLWLGVSVEDQATADERIPLLLETPAAKRLVSIEPLIGKTEIDIEFGQGVGDLAVRNLDLVIAGCESGTNRRPAPHDWFRSLRDECAEEATPFYLKQMAANPDGTGAILHDHKLDGVVHDALPWGCGR